MSAIIYSAALSGLDALPVEVEADIANGLTSFVIVGLPDTAVQESRERVRTAIKNSGMQFPRTRVTVNLAPADIKKEGPAYDLPIAISILKADGVLPPAAADSKPSQEWFVGELALNGALRPVAGIISIALAAKERGVKTLFVPKENVAEAALVPGVTAVPVSSLIAAVDHLLGKEIIEPFNKSLETKQNTASLGTNFSLIQGQERAKRALEIAAAGNHNILLSGPPGTGKTLLARALPTILPEMTLDESLEVTRVWSVAGLLNAGEPLMQTRPFRSPHHTSSHVALVGGGSFPRPGEISLAHRGVLFLDEFPEFSPKTLECLRQPLEDGFVTVSRAAGTLRFPARFLLVAAQNPCPCGFSGPPRLGEASGKTRECVCTAAQIIKYQKRISGPMLDRIDLAVEVPAVSFEKLEGSAGESSEIIRGRVAAARAVQLRRFTEQKKVANSEMTGDDLKKYCGLDETAKNFARSAMDKYRLSARAYHRSLKVARTIADLEDAENVEQRHLAEALQYRPKNEG